MVCTRPRDGYVSFNGGWTRDIRKSPEGESMRIPCKQCLGCLLERSRQWAMRCTHEQQMHDWSCFITLTYNDEFCRPSLDIRDFQKFMKRYRRWAGEGLRVFYCGEYGAKNLRPHWHAIVFGHDFSDKTLWQVRKGIPLYRSKKLEELWSCPETGRFYGFASVGTATFESAAYVARYVTKKQFGNSDWSEDFYTYGYHPETGEIMSRTKEFAKMSLKPGIGASWYEKYWQDVYPSDFVVFRGRKMRPPIYYDRLLERHNPDLFLDVKDARRDAAENYDYLTDERLFAKEVLLAQRTQRLVRELV